MTAGLPMSQVNIDSVFRSKCSMCSCICCTKFPAFLNECDINNIIARTGLRREDFVTLMKGKNGRMVEVIRRKRNGSCMFFNEEKGKCRIYELRPSDCRLFPLCLAVEDGKLVWVVNEYCKFDKWDVERILYDTETIMSNFLISEIEDFSGFETNT